MKATTTQAHRNEKNLRVKPSGYGHWEISCTHRGKTISTVTNYAHAVDDWNSDEFDTIQERKRHGRPANRKLAGYIALCERIIRDN